MSTFAEFLLIIGRNVEREVYESLPEFQSLPRVLERNQTVA